MIKICTLSISLLLALVFCGVALAAERTQSFDSDPQWEGRNNRIIPREYPTIVQDFGYSKTNFASKSSGEMGGHLTRASTPAV